MPQPSQNDYLVWHQRIKASAAEREHHAVEWRRTLGGLAGPHFRRGFGHEDRGLLNLANNYVRVLLPQLLGRDQVLRCAVSPKKGGDQYAAGAEQLADRVTAVMSAIRLVVTARRAIKAALYSAGILKVGLEVRTGQRGTVPSSGGDREPEVVDVDADRVQGEEFYDAGLPFCSWVPALRFYPDPGQTTLESCRWVAHRMFRTLEAVKADPRFAQFAEQLTASHAVAPRELAEGSTDGREDEDRKDPRLGMLGIYEIYDRAANRVLYLPDERGGVQSMIGEGEWPAGIEGFPFVMLAYEEVEDFFWPNPPLAVNAEMMRVVDRLGAWINEAAHQAKTIYVYDPQEITPEALRPIETAPHGSFVPLRGLSKQNFVPVELGAPNRSHWEVLERFKALADELVGIRENQRGVTSAGGKATATEVSEAAGQSGMRMGDMKAEGMAKLGRVAEMIAALLMAHAELLADQSLPVGQGEERKTVDFREPVEGEAIDYLYEVAVGEQPKTDPAILQKRTQDMIGMAQDPALNQKLQGEGKTLLVAPLLERQLRAVGEENPDKFLVDINGAEGGGDAAAQAQQEDAEMARSGQALPAGPQDDHQTHLQVHGADYQASQNEAIAQHIMAHEMAMQQGGGGAGPAPGGPPGPVPAGSPTAGPSGPGGGAAEQLQALLAGAKR